MALPSEQYPVEQNKRHIHVGETALDFAVTKGVAFTILKSIATTAGVPWVFNFVVPEGYRARIKYDVDTIGAFTMIVRKDDAVSGGTVYLARNRNEESDNVNTVEVTENPNVDVEGVELANISEGAKDVRAGLGVDTIIWPPSANRTFSFTTVTNNTLRLRFNFILEEVVQ